MTKENFIELIETSRAYDKELDRWNDFGINLFDLKIAELGWKMFDAAINASFTDEGVDWINWWMFEKNGSFSSSMEFKAYDENDVEIPTETVDDLWELVKEYQING